MLDWASTIIIVGGGVVGNVWNSAGIQMIHYIGIAILRKATIA